MATPHQPGALADPLLAGPPVGAGAGRRHLMHQPAPELLKAAGLRADDADLAPAAAEDVPPELQDAALERHAAAARASLSDKPVAATLTPAVDPAAPASAPSATPSVPAPGPVEPFADTAGDCGGINDAGGGGGGGGHSSGGGGLSAAAGAAAARLSQLASVASAHLPALAGELSGAARQLSSAFRGAADEAPPATSSPAPPEPSDSSAGGGGRGAPLVTQTASGRLAAVPSETLDLRPHVGPMAGGQHLLAAALASVGSLARAAQAQAGGGGGRSGSGSAEAAERALTSAATALERAMQEIGAAASDIVRDDASASAAAQQGPGLAGTGEDRLALGALPGDDDTAANGAAATSATADGNGTNANSDGAASDGGSSGGGGDFPFANVMGRIPPGFTMELNATSAAFVPEPPSPPAAATGGGGGADASGAGVATKSAYVYDTPDSPVAASSGAGAGAADACWDDPAFEVPAAPASGGAGGGFAVSDHDAAVLAAADAIPSVIPAIPDPSTAPLGRVSGGSGSTPFHQGSLNSASAARATASASPLSDPAAAAAKLPTVPTDLDAAAAGPPGGLQATKAATEAAMATMAPPHYVTPLPPGLAAALREPSARDLSDV